MTINYSEKIDWTKVLDCPIQGNPIPQTYYRYAPPTPGGNYTVAETANTKQIGGKHYKGNAIQPWDYVIANNLGYLEGSAIKYITRWKAKGGINDIKKAIHFLEKLIEVNEPSPVSADPAINR